MRSAFGRLVLALSLWMLPLCVATAAVAQCIPLSDFSGDTPGSFPRGWGVPRDDGYQVYKVMEEDGVRFLRGSARGTGTQAGLENAWDLQERPILTWRWRPRIFPEGSDERHGRTNDSALGVYVGFPRVLKMLKSVKYVWSRIVPVGATATASAGFTKMLVLRTGPSQGGRWVEERVDVLADYRRLFGEDPDRPRGIGVLTDSDDTRSVAEGDYMAFRACRP